MRLLYLQQLLVLPQCPGNPRCFEFARYWTQAGHEVHFVSSTAGIPRNHPVWRDKQTDGSYLYEGIYFHFFPIDYNHLWSFSKRIQSFYRFYRAVWSQSSHWQGFDRLIAYSAPLSVGELGRRLSQYLDIPFVFEVADVWPDVPIEMGIIPRGPWRAWLHRRTLKIYAQAGAIAAFSEGMKKQILQHGVAPERIHVIHNGTNFAQFSNRERSPSANDKIRLIYTGTIGIANHITQIAQAAKQLWEEGEDQIEFIIIGSGNDAPQLKAFLEQHSLPNFSWKPQVSKEEALKALHRADIGLSSFAPFPVLEANSATKFYDYLAAGLPLIINYQGWQAEYLMQYQCGLSSPQGDSQAFLTNIKKLAEDQALRTQMGLNAQKLAKAKFDRAQLAQRMLALIIEQ
ncbi:MAG: glycosyltransferase family 4 protein [Bacteroidota bacterium]